MPRTAFVACLLVLLVGAPAAFGQSTRTKILRECQDGRLTGDYTSKEIRDALRNIPDDIDQYSDCRDVLRRALLSQTGGGGGTGAGGTGGGTGGTGGGTGGGGGGNTGGAPLTPSTDADRQALQEAANSGRPIDVGGRRITPGEGVRNELPPTLIAVLALLALVATAAVAPFVRRYAFGRLTVLRRVLPGRSG